MHIGRRGFMAATAATALALALPRRAAARTVRAGGSLQKNKPQKGCVLWYSQTGHTGRYGRLIARCWEKEGIAVATGELKQTDPSALAGYDLIAIGTPVHYLEVPQNVQDWLARVPSIAGAGIAAFASFGGKGGGQHNAAVAILAALADRGGVPLGMGTFGNMSAYPPTWSTGNEERTLKFRDKPDQATYGSVRRLAADILERYGRGGQGIVVQSETSFTEPFGGAMMRGMAKLTIGKHDIDRKLCTRCGTCVNRCPVEAIDLAVPRVDTGRCLLCFGCLNNCPAGAHDMTTFGKKITSFAELLRRHGITIREPGERA